MLDADDRVEPSEPTLIEDGMTVRVVRVEVRLETEQRTIPFQRRTVQDTSVPQGETKLLEPGVTGLEEIIYRVTLEDGLVVQRQIVRRRVISEPRDELILIGAQRAIASVPISGTIVYIANRSPWVIRTNSHNQRRLADLGDLDGRVFALSSDGAYLLFTRVISATETAVRNTEDVAGMGFNQLWILDTVAADAEPISLDIYNVLWADWAPNCRGARDGRTCRIAFTTGLSVEGNPNWRARNDLQIAWLRARDGQMVGLQEVVGPNVGGVYGWWGAAYAWAPDARTVAYASADEIGLIRLPSGERVPLVRFPPYRTYAPWVWVPTLSWSPEGRFIVTTLHRADSVGGTPEDSPIFDVCAVAADGTLTAVLSSEAGMWASPIYAPRGDYVAFGRARSPRTSQNSGYDLFVMDRDGSGIHGLFPPSNELGITYPKIAWGPDGGRLIVVYQGNLVLITLADARAFPITNDGGVTAVQWR